MSEITLHLVLVMTAGQIKWMLNEKARFPYEWLDDYERLSHIGPVLHKAFYSMLKGNIIRDEYHKFVQNISEQGCKTMMDWLKVSNKADIILFIEAV